MIRLGILGAGRVVQARLCEVFRDELKSVRVMLVCDKVREKADRVAQSLKATAVYDIQKVLSSRDIDVVLVATESGHHYQHAKMSLEAGKHVIVEKPPVLFPEQVLELEKYAKTKKLMYAVIFQNRLNPAMKILKKSVAEGRFGRKVLVTIRLRWCRYQDYYDDGWHGTWEMDGGVISQQAIHHLDAMQWICGPIAEVSAMQANALNRLEAEDTTVATVRFKDGGLGVIEATTAARPCDFEASISVVGEKGFAVINGIALNKIETWQFMDAKPEDKDVPKEYSQEVPTGYGLSHGPLLQEIVDRLKEGRTDAPITGTDAIPVLKLVHALYCSVENGQITKLDDGKLSSRLGRRMTNV